MNKYVLSILKNKVDIYLSNNGYSNRYDVSKVDISEVDSDGYYEIVWDLKRTKPLRLKKLIGTITVKSGRYILRNNQNFNSGLLKIGNRIFDSSQILEVNISKYREEQLNKLFDN